jgi:hypothetical protein
MINIKPKNINFNTLNIKGSENIIPVFYISAFQYENYMKSKKEKYRQLKKNTSSNSKQYIQK